MDMWVSRLADDRLLVRYCKTQLIGKRVQHFLRQNPDVQAAREEEREALLREGKNPEEAAGSLVVRGSR